MSIFEKIVEEKIQLAMANGEFDNLPGKGRPLNLDDYFKIPPELRMTFQILKNYGLSPCEVELKKEIYQLRENLTNCAANEEKKKLTKLINYKSMLLNIELEKNKHRY